MNILSEIVEKLRPRLDERKQRAPLDVLAKLAQDVPERPAMVPAFLGPGTHIIAEIKKASPSKGLIRPNLDVQQLALELAQNGAAALSVLTEPNYFLGSEENLSIAAKTVDIPLLRKDFIFDEYQILEAKLLGASCVLLIAAMLSPERFKELLDFAHSMGLAVLGEAHTEAELAIAVQADLVGVNARNLKSFETSLETSAALIAKIPSTSIAIAESAIRNADDIHTLQALGARGFLIGETLMRAEQPGQALKELLQ